MKRPIVFREKRPDPARVYRPPAPKLTDAGRIARHRFYNRTAWKRCRAAKLRAEPLCERCRGAGRLNEATQVHHKVDLADAPELAFTMSNLESLCQSCHSRETLARMRADGGSR